MDSSPLQDAIHKLGEFIKDIKIAMLTTIRPDGSIHSRPMATQKQEFAGDLWFITSVHSHKADELRTEHRVNVTYASPDNDCYVSVSGTAEVIRDQAKLDQLWSPTHFAWFPKGKDDPDIALIRVQVEDAEYWDAPEARMVQMIGFAKAALTGEHYTPGEHKSIRLDPGKQRSA